MRGAWLWLASAGCLLLEGPPPGLQDPGEPACDPDDCPGEYGCYDGECADRCFEDGMCKEGAICTVPACELPCRDRDCPNGFTCKDPPLNECETRCWFEDDCRPGWACCEGAVYGSGECDDYGLCYEP